MKVIVTKFKYGLRWCLNLILLIIPIYFLKFLRKSTSEYLKWESSSLLCFMATTDALSIYLPLVIKTKSFKVWQYYNTLNLCCNQILWENLQIYKMDIFLTGTALDKYCVAILLVYINPRNWIQISQIKLSSKAFLI